MVEVISFSRSFPHASKHGYTAVLHGDVVDHLHHDNRLAHAGAAKHPHLAAPRKRHQQIYNLNTCLKHIDRGVQFRKGRGFPVNRQHLLTAYLPQPVNRPSHDIEHAPQGRLSNRHHDRLTSVLCRHTPNQTVRGIHCNCSDNIVAEMLSHLNHQIVRLVVDSGIGDGDSRQDRRELSRLKLNVHTRPHHLYDLTYVLCCSHQMTSSYTL